MATSIFSFFVVALLALLTDQPLPGGLYVYKIYFDTRFSFFARSGLSRAWCSRTLTLCFLLRGVVVVFSRVLRHRSRTPRVSASRSSSESLTASWASRSTKSVSREFPRRSGGLWNRGSSTNRYVDEWTARSIVEQASLCFCVFVGLFQPL